MFGQRRIKLMATSTEEGFTYAALSIMNAANAIRPDSKASPELCAICDQAGADRKFYVGVSAPSTDLIGSTQFASTDTVYFSAWCCGDCFPRIERNQKTSATLGKVFGAIAVAGVATLFVMFPDISVRNLIFGALMFLGVCAGVGYMIYSVFTPPQPRPRDSELQAFAKQISRKHLRNATPTLELLATKPSYEIVAEFVMPPQEGNTSDA